MGPNNTKPCDEDLVQSTLQGGASAFEELYERYYQRSWLYFKNRCKPPLEADDLTQGLWLKLKQKLSRWNPEKSQFVPWMFTVANHFLIDELRKFKRNRTAPLPESVELESPEPRELSRELQYLNDCLKAVGAAFIDVLKMKLDGLSSEEISLKLQIPTKTVDTKVFRSKKQIRECMERKLKQS